MSDWLSVCVCVCVCVFHFSIFLHCRITWPHSSHITVKTHLSFFHCFLLQLQVIGSHSYHMTVPLLRLASCQCLLSPWHSCTVTQPTAVVLETLGFKMGVRVVIWSVLNNVWEIWLHFWSVLVSEQWLCEVTNAHLKHCCIFFTRFDCGLYSYESAVMHPPPVVQCHAKLGLELFDSLQALRSVLIWWSTMVCVCVCERERETVCVRTLLNIDL